MGAEQPRERQDAPAFRGRTPRWHYVYFLLAAFDLVTVSAGLTLNHRIMAIYLRSVEVNRVWADRVSAYSHLGELAGDVDAPGNDVFDTRKVDQEAARMELAVRTFDADLQKQRRELQADLDPRAAAPLLALLEAIAVAKTQMTLEAGRIFDYFREGRADLAGERMATMDHKYASLNAALLELRRAVSAIQQQNFLEQTGAAAELQRYEYGIGLSIVLMVLGATVYGHKIARQMQANAEERERHVDALQTAETRTRSILDTAAEGIISFDAEGRIEMCNAAAERLFTVRAADAIGRDVGALVPAMAEQMRAAAFQPSAAPTPTAPVIAGERVGVRGDGSQFPLEFSLSAVNAGRARTFTAIVRDISDRRKAEEALAIAAAAQAANRAKSRFLANMSHEIRTPMSGVLGMAEMLLDTALSPTQRRYAETVHRSGESLLRILDSILDFSKIEAGKVELEQVVFSPRELVDEVTQLLRDGADRKGLMLTSRVAAGVPGRLRGAPSRLRQILINLIGNAIKFTDTGSVTVTVAVDDGPIDGKADPADATPDGFPGTLLYVAVTDTGIGIAGEVQPRLFRAFEQADSSTTRSYGGTGLGLAISRELVEQMGGRIGVRSALGQGSEFWFSVPMERPVAPAPAVESPRAPDADAAPLHGVRVLLAEDNPTNQDVARTMLRSLGCQVTVAATGVEALAVLEQQEFDIVLMDRHMPEMDGFDTTAAIRARGLVRPRQPRGAITPVRLPIVGLTASALKGDREMCLDAGMDDYLAKPFRREALRSLLERWGLNRGDAHTGDPAAAAQTFDATVIERMSGTQGAAAPRMAAGLMAAYVEDAPRLIEAIERAAAREDAAALGHAARSLAVHSQFVGAGRLADLCLAIEPSEGETTTAVQQSRVARLRQEYEAAVVEMAAVRPTR